MDTAIGAESYRLALVELRAKLEEPSSNISRLTEKLKARNKYIINNQEVLNKSLSVKASDHSNSVIHEGDVIKALLKRLQTDVLPAEERSLLKTQLLHHINNQNRSTESIN
jgi:hypothetical protein